MSAFESAFCYAEEKALRFLVQEFDFHPLKREVIEPQGSQAVFATVTYARQSKRVTLSIAPLRLELDLSISEDSNHPFSVEELHHITGGGLLPPCRHNLYEAMNNPDELLDELTRLAQILKKAGERFFTGEASLWTELSEQRAQKLQAAEDSRTLNLSEQAFQDKNWARVVTLLTPIATRQPKVAVLRFEYARKMLKNAT